MRTRLRSRHLLEAQQPFKFQTCALVAVAILAFLASHAVSAHQQTGADFSTELSDVELFPNPFHTSESYPGKYKSLLEILAAENAARQKEDCPPCFNCLLPAFECTHFSNCSEYDGKCVCPAGFGGDNCSQPLCGALSDGRNRKPRVGSHCDCPDGWSGINCNVCEANDVCNPMVITGQNATCYKGGLAVVENHQMCDVTNKKILDSLPADQKPQVTFACNREEATCDFQFWTGERESFYCTLNSCEFEQEQSFDRNVTRYACPHITCKCVPGELLCGGGDGLDLTDFFDCIDPDQCLGGPARFQCDEVDNSGARGAIECIFDEPAMDDLIMGAFGDPYIFLSCNSGECLHYTQVPGFMRPERPDNTLLVIISIASAGVIVLAIAGSLFYFARKNKSAGGAIRIADDEAATLMANHVPATVMFKDIQYTIRNKPILHGVTGVVAPSKVMAIMGASGAGKTSLLDILARKAKTGNITGDVLINGRKVDDAEFKRIVGFVDQEDHLMATLTVYETILYSALLRLPRDMSLEAKKYRVMETMQELGILGIKDSRIGSKGKRSISGGEKRRVSIACELVTSPSILFLDEPTSGLDAYNAFNVVECLVTLAREYNRTIICTIHQPRSNIFALFDQLVLLARGYVVYSGSASGAQSYMDDIGYPCPAGFNIADYLVDLTMHVVKHDDDTANENGDSTMPGLRRQRSLREIQDDELYTPRRRGTSNDEDISTTEQWESELEARERGLREERLRRQQLGQVGVQVDAERPDEDSNLEHIMDLVRHYKTSLVSRSINQEISVALANANDDIPSNEQNGGIRNISKTIKTYRRPTWWSQFIILSGRTFKNLYRNPMLMLTHYIISVLLAVFCGILFFNVTLDIAGFQNRMGIFFFICALFSFEALSSIQVFATERLLFVRERANEYYAPLPYFAAKIFFDLIPLRVIPALLMGIIVYPMVGLVPETQEFLKFLLVIVLFNLTSASICLAIGVVFSSPEIASLLAILLMLFSMLFGGLFLNNDSYPTSLKWLKDISFFHYAFEALIVNEMRYLQLTEMKYGLQIDVPGATILTTFGFNTAAYWTDTTKLGIMFLVLIAFAFLWLQAFVRDLR